MQLAEDYKLELGEKISFKMSDTGVEVFEFLIPEDLDNSITHIVFNFELLNQYDMTEEFHIKIQSTDKLHSNSTPDSQTNWGFGKTFTIFKNVNDDEGGE